MGSVLWFQSCVINDGLHTIYHSALQKLQYMCKMRKQLLAPINSDYNQIITTKLSKEKSVCQCLDFTRIQLTLHIGDILKRTLKQ